MEVLAENFKKSFENIAKVRPNLLNEDSYTYTEALKQKCPEWPSSCKGKCIRREVMLSVKSFYIEWKLKGNKARLFMFLGALFLLFALIGVAIPIIPQVPFAIISAFFFSKGSTRFYLWMRQNKYFGKAVRDWEDFRVIRPKIKIIATVSMLVGALLSHMKLNHPWPYILDVVFIISIFFVLTTKSRVMTFFSRFK